MPRLLQTVFLCGIACIAATFGFAASLDSGIYKISLTGGRSGCGSVATNDREYLGFSNHSCSVSTTGQRVGPFLLKATTDDSWVLWNINVLDMTSNGHYLVTIKNHYPSENGQPQCLGNLLPHHVAQCATTPDASLFQIKPASPYIYRLVPMAGSNPVSYRVIAESRKGGCRRFMSTHSDCDKTDVVMAMKDDGSGRQRWVFDKVESPASECPSHCLCDCQSQCPFPPAPDSQSPPSPQASPELPEPTSPTPPSPITTSLSPSAGIICDGTGEVVDSDGRCICNGKLGFESNGIGGCRCMPGFSTSGSFCCKDAAGLVPDGTNGCICDSSINLVESIRGACVCNAAKHFIEVNGMCVCDASSNWVPDGENDCKCNADKKFVLDSDGSCTCDAGQNWVVAGKNDCKCESSFTLDQGFCRKWKAVGATRFSASSAYSPSLAIDTNNVPYLAYEDGDQGGAVTVMKFNSTADSWQVVGSAGFSAGSVEYTSLAIDADNVPYVAYQDRSSSSQYKATVMKFNSTADSWQVVGSAAFSAEIVHYVSLAIDSDRVPYVAYRGTDGNAKATVMKFNSTADSWQVVGTTGFSAGEVYDTSLAIDANNVPYLAYSDVYDNRKATVMKFNSTADSWQVVGTVGFSDGTVYYTSLAIDTENVPYVGFKDVSFENGAATVMKFNFTSDSWQLVGTRGFSAYPFISTGEVYYTSLAIDADNVPYLAYKDMDQDRRATVMKYNSTSGSWQVVGTRGFSADTVDETSLALDANGFPYVAYSDNRANVMKYA